MLAQHAATSSRLDLCIVHGSPSIARFSLGCVARSPRLISGVAPVIPWRVKAASLSWALT